MPRLTEAQIKERRGGIGGSDIGVLMGMNKYTNPIDLFWGKTQGIDREVEDWVEEAGWWGHELESVVVRWFVERGPLLLEEKDWLAPEVRWAPVGRFYCTADRVAPGKFTKGLEIKTRSIFGKKWWGEQGTDKIPDDVYAQVQWCMMVYDLENWYVAVCLGGQQGRWYEIQRNQEWIDKAVRKAEEFWTKHVLTGEPPVDWNYD